MRNSSYAKLSIRNSTIKIICSKNNDETLEYNKVKGLDFIFDDSCPKPETGNDMSEELTPVVIEEESPTTTKLVETTTFKMVKEEIEITEIITKPNLVRTLQQEMVTMKPITGSAGFSSCNQKIFLFIPLLVLFNYYLF